MRMSVLIGIVLVALGGATLYQTQNGFLMYAIGHFTYWPPEDPVAVKAEFTKLASETSETEGITLGQVANARIRCATNVIGAPPKPQVATALRRLNLVLLGVGVRSQSPMIDPKARRLTELRRDLTRDARDWIEPVLNKKATEQFEGVMDSLTDAEHRMYEGVNLTADFGHLDFSKYVEVMLDGGQAFYECVKANRV